MTKNTKEPVRVNYVGQPNDLWVLDTESGKYIADVYGRHNCNDKISHDEGEANALLFAAALNAAQSLPKEYDPVKAVEGLGDALKKLENIHYGLTFPDDDVQRAIRTVVGQILAAAHRKGESDLHAGRFVRVV